MIFSISPAKVKPIFCMFQHYYWYSFLRASAQVCCWRQISIRLPYKDQKRLLIYSFRLLLSTVFFNRRSVSFTFSDFCFTLDKSPPPPSLDVAPTAYSAYFSRSCLRARRLRVTWDLDSFEVMVRYWLRVRMRSEAQIMPDIAAEKAIARPMNVPGQQSPQPIVPIVTMVHHKKSAKYMKSGLLSSARLNILEQTMTKVAQRMARECRGQVLKKDLAPKEPQFLVLQMRHILLARVERQMEELMMALQRRQILPIMKISSSELRSIGRVPPKTGQVSCRTTSSAARLGCISSTNNQIQMPFTH